MLVRVCLALFAAAMLVACGAPSQAAVPTPPPVPTAAPLALTDIELEPLLAHSVE